MSSFYLQREPGAVPDQTVRIFKLPATDGEKISPTYLAMELFLVPGGVASQPNSAGL
jgi:hypothetical protein